MRLALLFLCCTALSPALSGADDAMNGPVKTPTKPSGDAMTPETNAKPTVDEKPAAAGDQEAACPICGKKAKIIHHYLLDGKKKVNFFSRECRDEFAKEP